MIKVLVVDDDKLVRKGIVSAMPWADFNMQVVGEAANGEKALEFIRSQEVELLLTDLAMPVMSGIELMREVRREYPHIHIVILTLHQDFEYIQEALRQGAVDYIAKVQLEEERFEEVLGRIRNRIQEKEGERIRGHAEEGDRFYEQRTASSLQDGSRARAPAAASGQVDEDTQITRLKEQWSSPEWIHSEPVFTRITGELKELRLSKAKLHGLLYWMTDVWNRLFGVGGGLKLHMPEFDDWQDVEAWLRQVRESVRLMTGKGALAPEVADCVLRGVKAIHEQLDQPITAADIALGVNMSRSYFSQCFKEITGKTFNEYVRQVRLEKAKEYLLHSVKTIAWIAENTGYMDEKYFSRSFREQTGHLPSEYRRIHGKGRQMSSE